MVDGRVDKKAPMQICKELFADCKWMADVQMFDAVEETEGPGHASATMGGGWIVEIASWCHDVCIIAPGLHPLRSFSFSAPRDISMARVSKILFPSLGVQAGYANTLVERRLGDSLRQIRLQAEAVSVS